MPLGLGPVQAHEWFSLLVTSPKGRPTDPGVVAGVAGVAGQVGSRSENEDVGIPESQRTPCW